MLLAVLSLGLAALYWAHEPLLIATARALTLDDAEAPADYIVVLGGGAETRPFSAADLYRKGYAPAVLLFTHKTDRVTDLGLAPTHDELYRNVLAFEGVPSTAIQRVPGIVDGSGDEAQMLRRFLVFHPARRVILVTSAEHTLRARWIFRQTLADLSVDVRVAAARHLRFDETTWWKTDAGALAYLHEYLKLPFYWLRHQLGKGAQAMGHGN